MFEDAPWDVAYDTRFRSSLAELDKSSGNLKDNVTKTVRAIVEKPLKGDPKTGQLRGCRTTHIEHLVIVWELDPEIVSIEHLDKLTEIYFHDIKHHDKMRDAIGNKSPIDTAKQFEVTFESLDVQSVISDLYNCDIIEVQTQNWNGSGVVVEGTMQQTEENILEELLPDSATIELTQPALV